MKRTFAIFLMLLAGAGVATAKARHPSVSAAFATARTVYVETIDGDDLTDIHLDPDTRSAILDVQDAIEDWGRYSLSRSRYDADLIVVIYKGRLVRDPNDSHTFTIPINSSSATGRNPNPNPADAAQGTNGNNSQGGVDPERDELKVYTLGANGKLKDLLWHQEQVYGLDAPNVILVKQLEGEVDKAYPKP